MEIIHNLQRDLAIEERDKKLLEEEIDDHKTVCAKLDLEVVNLFNEILNLKRAEIVDPNPVRKFELHVMETDYNVTALHIQKLEDLVAAKTRNLHDIWINMRSIKNKLIHHDFINQYYY